MKASTVSTFVKTISENYSTKAKKKIHLYMLLNDKNLYLLFLKILMTQFNVFVNLLTFQRSLLLMNENVCLSISYTL